MQPELIKHIAGLYTAYNHEQFLEAARLHWLDFGHPGVHSNIEQKSPPVNYPVVIKFNVETNPSGDEPQDLEVSFLHTDLLAVLYQSVTMYNAPQLKEGDHILANAPKATRPTSRFSKIGPGQYTVESIEGFRSAAAAFWAENGKVHVNIQTFVRGAPTGYPAYCTFVTEYDDDNELSGVLANCIQVKFLARALVKYGI